MTVSREEALGAVATLLLWVGNDPADPGTSDTPRRVVDALREMTSGRTIDPREVLTTQFAGEGYDQMVVLRGIEFQSMCEHHMLPFTGSATVAYIPGEKVVGISKLARLVDLFARRLQIQERMTVQIAKALEDNLSPVGVGVMLRAAHSCMGCRGVRKPDAELVTSCVLGAMRDKPEARAELMRLL